MDNCFGFIDGTVRPLISKPGQNQCVVYSKILQYIDCVSRTLRRYIYSLVYSGHKRVHCVKFQSVALPNGIIGNMYGPIGKGNNAATTGTSLTKKKFVIFRPVHWSSRP